MSSNTYRLKLVETPTRALIMRATPSLRSSIRTLRRFQWLTGMLNINMAPHTWQLRRSKDKKEAIPTQRKKQPPLSLVHYAATVLEPDEARALRNARKRERRKRNGR